MTPSPALDSPALRNSQRRGAAGEADLFQLTNLVYDAALDPQAWPAFLTHYAEAIGASGANTHARNPQTSTFYFMAASGLDPAWLAAYDSYYSSVEPWLTPAISRPSGAVWTSPMLVPNSALERSEFYNDFLEPQDVRHICSVHVLNQPDAFAATSAMRPKWMEDFGAEEMSFARALYPHIQRAVQIHERLITLEGQRDSLGDALDNLSLGIILLDRSDRIAFANRRAREILAEEDGLTIQQETLHAAASRDRTRLQRLIASALRCTHGGGDEPGGLTAVSRPSGKRAYSLLVTPIRLPEPIGSSGALSVAVFVTDPERSGDIPSHALQRLHGLTEAEADLAISLAQGLTLAAAAEQAGITKETARSRLKTIFSKTDTHRQAELVRLVLTSLSDLSLAD